MHKDTRLLIEAAIVSAKANGDRKEAFGLMTIIAVATNPVLSDVFYQFAQSLALSVGEAQGRITEKGN